MELFMEYYIYGIAFLGWIMSWVQEKRCQNLESFLDNSHARESRLIKLNLELQEIADGFFRQTQDDWKN